METIQAKVKYTSVIEYKKILAFCDKHAIDRPDVRYSSKKGVYYAILSVTPELVKKISR
jgi:hypothetical protein